MADAGSSTTYSSPEEAQNCRKKAQIVVVQEDRVDPTGQTVKVRVERKEWKNREIVK